MKEQAAPTYKKGFGFHPLLSFVDHGAEGTGEPLSVLLRPGNAGSNTATDHILIQGFSWLQGLYLLTRPLVAVGSFYLPGSRPRPEAGQALAA